MAMYASDTAMHRDGHRFGDRNKRTSQGEGMRKRGSYQNKNKRSKKYRGQGRG